MTDAEAYAAPTPRVLYIHDDLSEYVSRQQGEASPAWQLTRELFTIMRRDPGHVVVLTLESQIERLLAQGNTPHLRWRSASVEPVNASLNNCTRRRAGSPISLVWTSHAKKTATAVTT